MGCAEMRIRIYKPCDVDGFTAVPLEFVDAVGSSRAVAIFRERLTSFPKRRKSSIQIYVHIRMRSWLRL